MSESKIKHGTIQDLKFDPKNANRGTERGQQALEESIQKFGLGRSVLVDKNGVILAGNKTVETSGALGIENVVFVPSDGKTIVAVVREDLDAETDPEARGIAIADNRVGELDLSWDAAVLLDSVKDIDNLDLFFSREELDDIMISSVSEQDGAGLDEDSDPDASPEVQEESISRHGDLWILRNPRSGISHRVLCGDSTVAEDVSRLMAGEVADMCFTDPPYGVNYQGGHLHKTRDKLKNDNNTDIYKCFTPLVYQYVDGPCYMWFSPNRALDAYLSIQDKFHLHALLVWYKINGGFGAINMQYKPKFELCLYFKPLKSTFRWSGPTNECSLWEIKTNNRNDLHPTQKPVELATRAIGNHRAKSVIDFFLGSGSTLIAAEQLSRQCYGLELDPRYVDVIVRRWQEFTGQDAVLDGDGRTFNEIEATVRE